MVGESLHPTRRPREEVTLKSFGEVMLENLIKQPNSTTAHHSRKSVRSEPGHLGVVKSVSDIVAPWLVKDVENLRLNAINFCAQAPRNSDAQFINLDAELSYPTLSSCKDPRLHEYLKGLGGALKK